MKTHQHIRWKLIRLGLDEMRSFLCGWQGHFVRPHQKAGNVSTWHTLADFPTAIRWRAELQEINNNRLENMALSCQRINRLLLHPGQIFSLRKIVGEPTEERGFKVGPNIVRGRLGFSAGGGLCQISTALFNAALLANLNILEKHNHSADIWGEHRFIDLGKDATYVFARKDLKFKNSHSDDIVLSMSVDAERLVLHCRICSGTPLAHNVEITHKIVDEIFPKGKDGSPLKGYRQGWVVLTQRYICLTGQKKKRTYRKVDRYRPVAIPLEL
jgi:vancomycin resistance protein VanW